MSLPTDEKEARAPLLTKRRVSSPKPNRRSRGRLVQAYIWGALSLTVLWTCVLIWGVQTIYNIIQRPGPLTSSGIATCAWNYLEGDVSLLDVPAITRPEFLERQSRMASALKDAGVDAFIAEPSASSAYLANISYSYELSERPFLMIIDQEAQFSYLVPKFEAGRIANLAMVYEDKKVIEWPEEKSPYEVLKAASGFKKVMLDEHVRYMIAAGLQAAGVEVVPMSPTIQSLRAVKSDAEIAILRGINQFTIQLVRSLQKCIQVGVTQETVTEAAHQLFTNAGIGKDFWAIVLFGDQASLPHGGVSGKTLSNGEFVLIDIGSNLHSYGSDVTRTILPDGSTVSDELMGIWKLVHASQAAAIEHMLVNETCSVVDGAARKVITDAGYGPYFTHRLGHGLGLEMHEHPYLNGANSETLKVGEVVTNEPGVYVTTEQAKKLDKDVGFGVRLEDPILVAADGGVPMTGGTARSPYEP
ncbi:putative mitochodrial aminopeptidase II [Coleophoma cylindrospora]|uniref:Probable Xaa-Pro aminopeptidase P n=1 Tax=Coleophoma cylindrospora TaxID=1849047 RepID=A0A3D8SSF5_9HELO|nr:putative mitochodrial aminopeptidase II [Coleophoma cylindrospora]